MSAELDIYIENINQILSRENDGPVFKRIELDILADEFLPFSSSLSDTDFLKFTARYSAALESLEQQINN